MKCKILSISVSNSDFFVPELSFGFSSSLNCIMGGRGTGKSTLLYFIKSCLLEAAEEQDKTLSNLLRSNLNNGKITLILEGENREQFRIDKTFGDEPLVSRVSTSETLSLRSLNEFFECDIYPALYIEEIGKSNRDRLELIEKPIKSDVRELKSFIRGIQISLRQNAQLIRTENSRLAELNQSVIEYSSVVADLKAWKNNKPAEFSETEQAEFETADEKEKVRHAELRYQNNCKRKLGEILESLDGLDDVISSAAILGTQVNFTNRLVTDEIALEIKTVTTALQKSSGAMRVAVIDSINKIDVLGPQLTELHERQQSEFIKLKQKFDQHREYINEYNQRTKRVEERKVVLGEIKDLKERISKLSQKRISLVSELNNTKKEIFKLRKESIDKLNQVLGGNIKVTLTFGGITDEYETSLRNALKGSNLRYNTIIPYIVETFTPDQFARIVHTSDLEELKKISEIDVERSKALVNALKDREEIYEIEALYADDLPEFFLKVEEQDREGNVRRENFKRSDDLSTGQRCTVVLPIVFAVSDNPLIIDQPEDNLDNEFINDTVRKIVQDQKQNRQLIFITHNPNIPVVSDAEFNLFLHYKDKRSQVLNHGSVEDVKQNILNLLEGGRKAFDKRRELYDQD